jgi:glycosyltransferase involved in cell wall biosynthesis
MTVRNPAVSFVLPVFNVAKYLPKCLDSILAQSSSDWEVIIVDDGSTDDSLRISKSYAKQCAAIHIGTQKNQGQGVARNTGRQMACGRYICFVDPDDWLDCQMVRELIIAMDSSGADFANFGIDFITEEGVVSRKFDKFNQRELVGEKIFQYAMIDQEIYSTPCNKIYKNAFLGVNEIAFPASRAYEDIYYSRLMAFHAAKCIFIGKIYYHALIRIGSTTRRMDSTKISEAIQIVELERAKFINDESPDSTRDLFDAHVVKLLSGLLIQAAYRIHDDADYMKCNALVREANFIEISKKFNVLASLKLKNRLMAKIAAHPIATRVMARILSPLGVIPY